MFVPPCASRPIFTHRAETGIYDWIYARGDFIDAQVVVNCIYFWKRALAPAARVSALEHSASHSNQNVDVAHHSIKAAADSKVNMYRASHDNFHDMFHDMFHVCA